VANELFEIQTKTCINNSLQTIDLLLDQDPTQGRDGMIHQQVRLIRELVGLPRYVRPPTAERVYEGCGDATANLRTAHSPRWT
jgi:hypothetical protein